jgi:hypothetical protein
MKLPEMIAVESSNVASVGYLEETKEIFVKFLNGGVYKYKDAPKETFDALLTADSVGCYLNKKVKNVYPYEKVVLNAN